MTKLRSSLRAMSLAVALFAGAALAADGVNVNSADAARLAEVLDGVGPTKAQAIVDYREVNGEFAEPMDLVNVRGIGVSTVVRNEGRILLAD